MIRIAFAALVVVHGLIHLAGFAKAYGLAALPQLAQPISRAAGALWLGAALALLATAAAIPLWPRGWWVLGALALALSQGAIVSSWSDARFGTLANLLLLAGVLHGLASQGPWSLRAEYQRHLEEDRRTMTLAPLAEADLAALPAPVQRYLRGAGALGRPPPQSLRATWRGRIRSDATSPWMAFTAEQLDTVEPPRRYFKLDATMKGLPVDVLHALDEGGATMRVKLLSVVGMADAEGAELTRAETVTFFNDLCVLAPGALLSPRIAWEAVDDRTARARFTFGVNTVAAELRFGDAGELVDFVSDDRSPGSPGGGLARPMRWSTPLSAYAEVGPARLATRGDTVWHAAAGPFVYGEFTLTGLAYDAGP